MCLVKLFLWVNIVLLFKWKTAITLQNIFLYFQQYLCHVKFFVPLFITSQNTGPEVDEEPDCKKLESEADWVDQTDWIEVGNGGNHGNRVVRSTTEVKILSKDWITIISF